MSFEEDIWQLKPLVGLGRLVFGSSRAPTFSRRLNFAMTGSCAFFRETEGAAQDKSIMLTTAPRNADEDFSGFRPVSFIEQSTDEGIRMEILH